MKDTLSRRDVMKLAGGVFGGAALAALAGCKKEEPPATPPEPEPEDKPSPTETAPPAEAKPAETTPPAEAKDMRCYVCSKCGCVYDPTKQTPPTPFPELPDTWKCPKCKGPKSLYKPKA